MTGSRRGRRPLRRSGAIQFIGGLLAVAGIMAVALTVPSIGRAASCQTSGPASGAYTASLCISSPSNGATVTGDKAVSVTISFTGAGPGVRRAVFYLDGADLLVDYQAPYQFTLPSHIFVDGPKTLEVEALLRDGFVTDRATVNVEFDNDVDAPPAPQTGFTPTSGTPATPGSSFVLAATGDSAGGEQAQADVAGLIASWQPNMFLYLGDVYEKGTQTEFKNWYGSSSLFGQFDPITNPAIGNHEYEDGEAPGYFDYWKSPPHHYSVDANGWHIISLDSTSEFGQTAPGSGQYQWLEADLEANSADCTLAFFHHPLYNVGPEGTATRMSDIWALLAAHGVDLVLTAHDHDYQRWTALDGQGNPSPLGITQFVVGSGGHGIQQFVTTDSRLAFGADDAGAFGALRLELNNHGAAFRYVDRTGLIRDAGSIPCSGPPTDSTPPSTPAGVTATAAGPNKVRVTWSGATDNVGVTGYDLYRNGALLASVGPRPSYDDTTISPELTYVYQLRARDAADNVSSLSAAATITLPHAESGLFSDDFETGNLSKWTSVAGLTVQQEDVFSGAWAALATSSGAATWAYKQLPSPVTSLYYRIRFKITSLSSTTYILKFRTGTGTSLLGAYVSNTGKLSYRNDISGQSTSSTTTVTSGVWHTLQLRLVINGTSGQTETWFDDVRIDQLSKTESLGTTPIGRVQLGENSTGRTYTIAYDTVLASTTPIQSDVAAPTTPPSVTSVPASSVSIDVSWGASTDNIAVAGYSVYRDGEFLAGLPATAAAYTDSGLAPSTTYSYTVDAFDAAGNHSAQSTPTTSATPEDTTPPSVPVGLVVNGLSSKEVDIAWSAATDDVGVTGYIVSRNGVELLPDDDEPSTVGAGVLSYIDENVVANTTYTYTVRAVDEAGNASGESSDLAVTTPPAPDVTPPTQPTGLTATPVSSTSIRLDWDAASDDLGVAVYTVYREGGQIASVGGGTLSYTDTTATPDSSYTYRVDAVDAAGNRSAQSAPATASTTTDTSPPSTPAGASATASGPTTVNVSWEPSTDNVAVTGYTVTRDGTPVGTVGGTTLSFQDATATANTTYGYSVFAVDAAGNESADSASAPVTTPADFLFADGFEGGSLSNWTSVAGLVVQQQEVLSGSWAARGTSTGSATWSYRQLSAPQSSLYFRIRFKILSQGSTVNLLKFRTGSGTSLLGVYVASNGKLGHRNDVAGQSTGSPVVVTPGAWHTLQVHVTINDEAGATETWLDGVQVTQLTKTEDFDTTPIGRIQLGENSSGRIYDIAFDDAVANTSLIGDP